MSPLGGGDLRTDAQEAIADNEGVHRFAQAVLRLLDAIQILQRRNSELEADRADLAESLEGQQEHHAEYVVQTNKTLRALRARFGPLLLAQEATESLGGTPTPPQPSTGLSEAIASPEALR